MSNCLNIRVVAFVQSSDNGDITTNYGFVAADSYGSEFSDNWDTYEEFYNRFPTKQKLLHYIVRLPAFKDGTFTENENDTGDNVFIEGYSN